MYLSTTMKKYFLPTLSILMLAVCAASAQTTIPAVLSDKIHKGSGVIDILRDVKAADLSAYLNANRSLFLGVDLNEVGRAPETSRSQGVAIQSMKLLLTTTAGDFSFGDFYTSTTAMIRASGATQPQEFYTLFGQTGSSQLTSSTTGFNLSPYDDVITIDNIAFTGEILSARLAVNFLETDSSRNAGVNEQFFAFSAGFEDFAILTRKDATVLEEAGIGQAEAPDGVKFETTPTPLSPAPTDGGATDPAPPAGGTGGTGDTGAPADTATPGDSGAPADTSTPGGTAGTGDTAGSGGATNPGSTAPGAPAPPLLLLVFGALLMGFYQWKNRLQGSSGAA